MSIPDIRQASSTEEVIETVTRIIDFYDGTGVSSAASPASVAVKLQTISNVVGTPALETSEPALGAMDKINDLAVAIEGDSWLEFAPFFGADFGSGAYYTFGNEATLSDILSFSRAGAGYARNSQGSLVAFNNEQPRITDIGLHLSPSAVFRGAASRDGFAPSTWGNGGTTPTVTPLSPDGPEGRSLVASPGSNSSRRRRISSVPVTSGIAHRVLARFEAGTSGLYRMILSNGAGNLSAIDGTVTSSAISVVDPQINTYGTFSEIGAELFSNGVWELQYVFTPNASSTDWRVDIGPYSSVVGADIVLRSITIAQQSEYVFPFRSDGGDVTSVADDALIPYASNIPYRDGFAMVEFDLKTLTRDQIVFDVSNDTGTDRVQLRVTGATSPSVPALVASMTSGGVERTRSLQATFGVNRVSVRWSSSGLSFVLNGNLASTLAGSPPSSPFTVGALGKDALNNGRRLNGIISKIGFFGASSA